MPISEPSSGFLIEAVKISKGFSQPDGSILRVLDRLDLGLSRGNMVAITGASGSGKSTLLHILGGLDSANEGQVLFEGQDICAFDADELCRYRNQRVGFIYQFHHLLPELLVWENVAFPHLIRRFDLKEARKLAVDLLDRVGLSSKEMNLPQDLSGGERQRVAIARSLINQPDLLLADEPTGNLDLTTGRQVFALFRELVAQGDLTAVVVTHNLELAQTADRHFHFHEGRLVPGGRA